MSEPKWLTLARKKIGEREIVGKKHSPFVLSLWQLIRAPFNDDETPWCAGFVGGMLELAGIVSTRSAWARSYLGWKNGYRIPKPVLGCIAVLERGPKSGHVFFVTGISRNGSVVYGIGGNQSNSVTEAGFMANRVLGYMWPKGVPVPLGKLPVMTMAGKISTNEA